MLADSAVVLLYVNNRAHGPTASPAVPPRVPGWRRSTNHVPPFGDLPVACGMASEMARSEFPAVASWYIVLSRFYAAASAAQASPFITAKPRRQISHLPVI
jgi:hypothetical protein